MKTISQFIIPQKNMILYCYLQASNGLPKVRASKKLCPRS